MFKTVTVLSTMCLQMTMAEQITNMEAAKLARLMQMAEEKVSTIMLQQAEAQQLEEEIKQKEKQKQKAKDKKEEDELIEELIHEWQTLQGILKVQLEALELEQMELEEAASLAYKNDQEEESVLIRKLQDESNEKMEELFHREKGITDALIMLEKEQHEEEVKAEAARLKKEQELQVEQQFNPAAVYDRCAQMGIVGEKQIRDCLRNVVKNIMNSDPTFGTVAFILMERFFRAQDIIVQAAQEALMASKAMKQAAAAQQIAQAAAEGPDLAAALAEAERLEQVAQQLKEQADYDQKLADQAQKQIAEEEALIEFIDDLDFQDHTLDKEEEEIKVEEKVNDRVNSEEQEFKYPDEEVPWHQFKSFNDQTIHDFTDQEDTPEEVDTRDGGMTILYWVLFIACWIPGFPPDIWDIANFAMYVVYDFSSAWELFEQEEMTTWAFYAIGSLVVGLAHGAYTIAMIVLTVMDIFFSDYAATDYSISISMFDSDNGGALFWIYLILNTVTIAVPLSKLIWIIVEDDQEEDGYFKMKTPQGKFNKEMEMYADISKMAVLAINYATFIAQPSIAQQISTLGLPVYGTITDENTW